MEHLEAWCYELTLGDRLTEATPTQLLEQATVADREARRLIRVANKTPITKGPKRHQRFVKATTAKVRQVYCQQLAAALASTGKLVVGDLSYAAAHMVRGQANAFGESWLQRQEAW